MKIQATKNHLLLERRKGTGETPRFGLRRHHRVPLVLTNFGHMNHLGDLADLFFTQREHSAICVLCPISHISGSSKYGSNRDGSFYRRWQRTPCIVPKIQPRAPFIVVAEPVVFWNTMRFSQEMNLYSNGASRTRSEEDRKDEKWFTSAHP